MKYVPMVSKRELEKFVPNRVLNGDGKINQTQWDYVKTLASAYMDKDSHMSPMGGMIKDEVHELADLLSHDKHHHFTEKQVEHIKAAFEDQIK